MRGIHGSPPQAEAGLARRGRRQGAASVDKGRCRARSRPEQVSRARAGRAPVTRDTVPNFSGYLRNARSSHATELCGCSETTHLRCSSQPVFSADMS